MQLQQVVFKLKKLQVPVDRFSNLKRVLFQKKAIFHLPCVKIKKAGLDGLKIASENGPHTKNGQFLPIFKSKKLLLIPHISTYLTA